MNEFEFIISNDELSTMLNPDNLVKFKNHYMVQKPSKWFAFIEKHFIVLDNAFDLTKLLVCNNARYNPMKKANTSYISMYVKCNFW
jgi:hypothetical protein